MKPSFNQSKTLSLLLLLSIIACSRNTSTIKLEKSPHQKALEKCIKKSFKEADWKTFNKCRKEHLALVERVEDSSSQAKNLFYSGRYFEEYSQIDSAYTSYLKSLKLYRELNNKAEIGRLLLNIAVIEKEITDYKSSEARSFEALEYLTNSKFEYLQSKVFNNLGLLYNQLDDTINALKYHNKSLNLKRQRGDETTEIIASLNNIGKIYKDHHQYTKALKLYKKGLDSYDNLKNDLESKATLLDNYGYCLFKTGKQDEGLQLMNQALSIRENHSFFSGIAVNNIHLSIYYAETNDTLTAIQYAEKAKVVSKKVKDNGDYKIALDLLSKLHNGNTSKAYQDKYNRFRDSLDIAQRNQREDFARIRYEFEEKNNYLIKVIAVITTTGIIALIVLFGLFLFRKRKKLKLAKAFAKGFRNYLIKKYNLSPENIDFWELWVTGLDQTQLAEQLFISVDAVKSRRKSLKKKIDVIQTIDGNFTQTKAIHIYNLEKDIFRNFN